MDDFKDTAQYFIDLNGEYCLKPNDATIKPPTSSPGAGCGSPDYVSDGQCDDDNNNADCAFDGGDCCPGDDPKDGWDDYCSVCECINDGGNIS